MSPMSNQKSNYPRHRAQSPSCPRPSSPCSRSPSRCSLVDLIFWLIFYLFLIVFWLTFDWLLRPLLPSTKLLAIRLFPWLLKISTTQMKTFQGMYFHSNYHQPTCCPIPWLEKTILPSGRKGDTGQRCRPAIGRRPISAPTCSLMITRGVWVASGWRKNILFTRMMEEKRNSI